MIMKKVVELKNVFTGEVVFCEDMKDVDVTENMTFIKVYRHDNPKRVFRVNKDAYRIIQK